MAVNKTECLFRHRFLSDKERKNISILDLIRKEDPISRTDISRKTGINIVTVSNYVNSYIEKGLVLETGLDISTGGRKPSLVELNKSKGYIIGIDIGPEILSCICTDLALNIIAKIRKDRPSGNIGEAFAAISDLVNDLLTKAHIDLHKVEGIGIGISGVINEENGTVRDTDPRRGHTIDSYNDLGGRFRKRFGAPVYIGNDATCAAFGEKRLNSKADVENLLYIYSDVGCGIVIKGEVYCGAGGSAGEIQIAPSTLLDDDRPLALSDESVAYLKPWGVDLGIVIGVKKAIQKGIGSLIVELVQGDIEKINLAVVIDAARRNDKLATELLESAALNLGVRIAYLINLFNPEVIVIGGGIEKAGELFLDPIRRVVKKLAFKEPVSIVKIIPSALGEDAVALGAAALTVREIFIEA